MTVAGEFATRAIAPIGALAIAALLHWAASTPIARPSAPRPAPTPAIAFYPGTPWITSTTWLGPIGPSTASPPVPFCTVFAWPDQSRGSMLCYDRDDRGRLTIHCAGDLDLAQRLGLDRCGGP